MRRFVVFFQDLDCEVEACNVSSAVRKAIVKRWCLPSVEVLARKHPNGLVLTVKEVKKK